jgi:nitrate/TMAO reductase-like tetraheme cytochrome c subunit
MRWPSKKSLKLLLLGAAIGVGIIALSAGAFSYTSSTSFCTSCHEMRIVAEQGWMKSKHYENQSGVVAECTDCHVEPELLPMIRTKLRDGIKDTWVHLFGESDPHRMNWEELAASARSKISDSACMRCHKNLTPRGAAIKTLVAHREYLRGDVNKRCVDCHREEIHGGFKEYLGIKNSGGTE